MTRADLWAKAQQLYPRQPHYQAQWVKSRHFLGAKCLLDPSQQIKRKDSK